VKKVISHEGFPSRAADVSDAEISKVSGVGGQESRKKQRQGAKGVLQTVRIAAAGGRRIERRKKRTTDARGGVEYQIPFLPARWRREKRGQMIHHLGESKNIGEGNEGNDSVTSRICALGILQRKEYHVRPEGKRSGEH